MKVKRLIMVAVLALSGGIGLGFAGEEELSTDTAAGVAGFRGILKGKILDKDDNSFVLEVEGIAKSWPQSKAKRPESVIGRQARLKVPSRNNGVKKRLVDFNPGDVVLAGALHRGGLDFSAVELLVNAEELPALQKRWAAQEKSARKGKESEARRHKERIEALRKGGVK